MRQPLRALTLLALVIVAALTACGTPDAPTATLAAAAPRAGGASSSPATPSSSPAALVITPTATTPPALPSPPSSPSPSPSSSASSTSTQCFYRSTDYMLNQSQTTQFQAALVAANFQNATGNIAEEGEYRVCSDGTSTFLLRTSKLGVTLPVADLADREKLGVLLEQILTVAKDHGTAPNKIYAVYFTMGGAQEYVRTHPSAWEQAHKQGLTGAALLDALQAQSR